MVAYSRPVVPPELLHEILSNLWVQGDSVSLKVCALVHQSWLPVVRPLIFRSVAFEQPNWAKFDNALVTFINTVQKNPNLGMHVRELSCNWAYRPIFSLNDVNLPSVVSLTAKRFSMIGRPNGDSTWPLLKLQRLTKIFLTEITFNDLDQFSACFEQAQGTNISTVQLHRICILQGRRETIRAAYMDSDDEDSIPEERQEKVLASNDKDTSQSMPRIRPQLQKLEIVRGHASVLALWFIKEDCPFDLTTLKTLRYEEDLEKPDITNLIKLLQLCAMSLENLEIYSPRSRSVFLSSLIWLKYNLSGLLETNNLDISPRTIPNLRHITISGISPYSIVNAIPWLSQLTRESQLRTLALKFWFGKLKLAENEQPVRTWQDLDDTVDNLPVLNLERIEVKIPDRKQKKSAQEISKTYLPRVMERSICVLTIL